MKPIPTWKERCSVYDNNNFQRQCMQDEIDALRKRVQELESDRDQYRMMWLREKEENDLRGGNGEAESRPRP